MLYSIFKIKNILYKCLQYLLNAYNYNSPSPKLIKKLKYKLLRTSHLESAKTEGKRFTTFDAEQFVSHTIFVAVIIVNSRPRKIANARLLFGKRTKRRRNKSVRQRKKGGLFVYCIVMISTRVKVICSHILYSHIPPLMNIAQYEKLYSIDIGYTINPGDIRFWGRHVNAQQTNH